MNAKKPQAIEWKWVGISLGMFLLFYFVPLFLLFNNNPDFKNGIQIFLGFWMFLGLFVISMIVGLLSKNITIKEPVISVIAIMILWFIGVQLKFKDYQHFTGKNYITLIIILIIVGLLSFAGAKWGEYIQQIGLKQKNKLKEKLMLDNIPKITKQVIIILTSSIVIFIYYGCWLWPDEKTEGEIAGQVTSNGQAVAGTAVRTSPNIGSTITDAQGNFAIANVASNQNYTLTANKEGYEDGTVSIFVGKKEKKIANITMVQKLPVLQIVNTNGTDFGINNTVFNFTLKNQSGFGTLSVSSIGISYPANTPAWLSFNPAANISVANGATGTPVAATADRNVLINPGNYQATVTFNSNGGNFTFTLTIAKPGPGPLLSVNTVTLDFGTGETSKQIIVKNNGAAGSNLNWSVLSDQAWLSISDTPLLLASGQQQTVTAGANRSGKGVGNYSGNLTFKNLADNVVQTVTVSMQVVQTNGTISGTVKDVTTNVPLQNVLISALPTSGTGGPYTTNTDQFGNYSDSVKTGTTYSVTAKITGYNEGTLLNVIVNSTNQNFALTQQKGSISGTVVDSANVLAKLQGVTVIAKGKIDNVSYSANPATTDANGIYSIPNLPATQNYDITASVAAYYSKTLTNIAVGQASLMIPLGKITGSISGTVTDSTSGLKVEGVKISVEGTTLSTLTFSDGSYTLSNIPLGTYKIVASKDNYFIGTATKDTSGITITNSTKTLNFTLGGKEPVNGMILFYPFNGNLKDRSGFGLDATGSGVTVNGSDRFGGLSNGAFFDGSTNYIVRNDDIALHTPTALSIALWIKFDKEPVAGTNYSILDKRTGTVYQYDLSYQIDNSSIRTLVFDTYADNAGSVFHQNKMQKTLSEGSWNFICVTFNGTQSIIYINGIQFKNIATVNPSAQTINNPSQGAPIYFGRDYNNKGYLKSYIDDVRLYNKALIESEIQALYNEGNWK